MIETKKIAGTNLLILIAYTLYLHFSASGEGKRMEMMIYMAFAIMFHVVICLIISGFYFRKKNKPLGKAYQLSAGIVLIIGFSTCLGSSKF